MIDILRTTVLGLGLFNVVFMFPSSNIFPDENEIGDVTIDHFVSRRFIRSHIQNGVAPPTVHTKISGSTALSPGLDLNLRFVPIHRRRQTPVYINGRKVLIGRNHKQECNTLYEDVDNFAHAVVDPCSTPGHIRMLAEVFYNGSLHLIVPAAGQRADGSVQHKLYSVEPTVDYQGDYAEPGRHYTVSEPQNITSRWKRAAGQNVVELIFIVDYPFYRNWYDDTTGTPEERETKAVNDLRTYLAFFNEAVSIRYRELKEHAAHNIDISVDLVGIIIWKTGAESTVTQAATSAESPRGLISATDLLTSFTIWVKDQSTNNKANFPVADHYMLLTYRDIFIGSNTRAAGYANLGAICEEDATSVVEWSFQAMSATTAAHELAHGLSGQHDGDGNTCDSADYYILAVANLPGVGNKSRHPWIFSDCSAKYIDDKVDNLNTQNKNCLIVDNNSEHVDIEGAPMGQRYSPDQQCKHTFGHESELARAGHQGDWGTLCSGMWCSTTSILQITIELPLYGTTCGNKKWCQNGECIAAPEAPEANPDCLFGDQPTEFENGRTCQIVEQDMRYCYNSRVVWACCGSCLAKKLDIEGCPYGDRSDCTGVSAADCYDANTIKFCCKTCADYLHPDLPADCKYGDKLTGCSLRACELHRDDCCGTCNGVVITKKPTVTTKKTPENPDPKTTAPSVTTKDPQVTKKDPSVTEKDPSVTKKDPSVTTKAQSVITPDPGVSTTESSTGAKKLEDWVVPVAAVGGGVLAIALVVGLACVFCCRRKQPNNSRRDPEKRRNRERHDNKDRQRDKRRQDSRSNKPPRAHQSKHGHQSRPDRHKPPSYGYSRY